MTHKYTDNTEHYAVMQCIYHLHLYYAILFTKNYKVQKVNFPAMLPSWPWVEAPAHATASALAPNPFAAAPVTANTAAPPPASAAAPSAVPA